MSLASLKTMKVLGVNIWLILLIVVVLVVIGLVIVRKAYRKFSSRKQVVVEEPIQCTVESCPLPEKPVEHLTEPEETKKIEEVVKNALGDDAYTVDIKTEEKNE